MNQTVRPQSKSEPTITCPNCRHEIKLTESLAAPLLEATRHRYEAKLAEIQREMGTREAAVRAQQAEVEAARTAIAEEVATKLHKEWVGIAAEEGRKAQRASERCHSLGIQANKKLE
jgi:hypothetical protein